MLLFVYGEVIDVLIDLFDCEKVFIDCVMMLLCCDFLGLKVVFEYIMMKDVVDYVCDVDVVFGLFGVMIIVYYLLYNCNVLFVGGICLYYYCLLVLKCEMYCVVLVEVVMLGNLCFFFGIDSVLYVCDVKEIVCGCVGCYMVLYVFELYVEVFDMVGVFDKLEGFVSFFGVDFYGLLCSVEMVMLCCELWELLCEIFVGEMLVVLLCGGEMIGWKLV